MGTARFFVISFLLFLFSACAVEPKTLSNINEMTELSVRAESICSNDGKTAFPTKPFKTDGCALFPDYTWQECCINHDIEYWCGGTSELRRKADRDFQECVAATGHPSIGALMHLGVRLGGASFLTTWWRWGYGWPWPESGFRTKPDQPKGDNIESVEE